MSSSIIVKVIIILLVIVGIMQLTAQNAVEKQIQKNAEEVAKAQQHYNQRVQEHNRKKQIITTGNLGTQQERHDRQERRNLIKRIGRPLSSIKRAVIQYKSKHNAWPEDMIDLGQKYEGINFVLSIKIDNGEIYAFLSEKYGTNKIVRLYSTNGYTWQCSTNLQLKEKTEIADATCSEEPNISFNGRYIQ